MDWAGPTTLMGQVGSTTRTSHAKMTCTNRAGPTTLMGQASPTTR